MFTLQKLFYKKVGIGRGSSKTKKKKKTAEEVVSKHSGILGLCAFVNAFPYDVPEFVPDILMVLSDHLHDPQPIPVIIMTFFKTVFGLFWAFVYGFPYDVLDFLPDILMVFSDHLHDLLIRKDISSFY